MREALSKRTRSQSTAKTAARSSSRAKTASSRKSGARTAAAPKRTKPAPAAKSKKSAVTKKVTLKTAKPKVSKPKAAKPSAKKAINLKAKPKPKVKLSKVVKFKSKAKLKRTALPPRGKVSAKTSSKGKQKTQSKRAVAPPPPPPEPPRRQVASAVLRAFEHAVKVFNRRQFAEAKPLFESLQHRYPEEVEINARAQTYIHVCDQKLARPPSSPRDAEELYDRGVVALNIGDFTQARTFFEKALRLRPDAPHVLYSLAATHAQTGASDQALDYLTRSIQMQPRFRTQAMNDVDFSGLREDKRFIELLGIASPFDLLESRH